MPVRWKAAPSRRTRIAIRIHSCSKNLCGTITSPRIISLAVRIITTLVGTLLPFSPCTNLTEELATPAACPALTTTTSSSPPPTSS